MTEDEVEAKISETAAKLVSHLTLGDEERALQLRALIRAIAILVKVYGVDPESVAAQLASDVSKIEVTDVLEAQWDGLKSARAQA